MTDWAFLSWPTKRLFRALPAVTEAGWWLVSLLIVGSGAVGYGFYRAGTIRPELITTLTSFFLIAAAGLGLWLGYSRVVGERPAEWQLISRAVWAYRELLRGITLFLIASLPSLACFVLGAQVVSSRSGWTAIPQDLSLLVAVAATIVFGSAVAVVIKLLTRWGFLRLALFGAMIYGLTELIWLLRAPLSATISSLTTTDSHTVVLFVVVAIGWSGLAIAVAELVMPRWPISLHSTRRYIATRLPTTGLGGFGAGTAAFTVEIIHSLRSSQLLRRFVLAVVVLVVGIGTLNLFSSSYPQNAERLFLTLVAVTIGFFSVTIGQKSGGAAARLARQYQRWPVKPGKIYQGVLAGGAVTVVVATAILIELFAAGVVATSWLLLLEEIALAAFGVGFLAGLARCHRSAATSDPLLGTVTGGALAVLIIVFGALVLFFFGVVTPLVSAGVIASWALGSALIFLRWSRQGKEAA